MYREINLELDLKVFKKTDGEYIRKVVEEVFDDWRALLCGRERISIMLWISDGSDILDYNGDMSAEIEWARYVGCARTPELEEGNDRSVSLHEYHIKYMKNPPVFTYGKIAEIVGTIKAVGRDRHPGAKISVGVPFDIGPEFSKSDFKYKRHTEICKGVGEGGISFVDSYERLAADTRSYKGYPDGIPDGTPFAEFLGRQARHYMTDLGFDYLWLSNGVGFSASSWDPVGTIFDGVRFNTDKFDECAEKVFKFWTDLRRECPEHGIYTRGTNFSAGIDYAVDAVPLYKLYNAGFNFTPPPNSPWAAINANYGLEIVGHMTRNCELPGDDFMFRYYLHDPWWINSPWYDRYNQSPHDLYLPMSVGRIGRGGEVRSASILNILSINNTYGEMPKKCVNEVLPHLLKAEDFAPDGVAPFVWVYPLREYTTATDATTLKEIIGGDLFMCRAVEAGFPINTVVSRDNYMRHDDSLYKYSVLLTPVPKGDDAFERRIFEFIDNGGRVLFYGSLRGASREFLEKFEIEPCEFDGAMTVFGLHTHDEVRCGEMPDKMILRRDMCGGIIPADRSIMKRYKNAVWYLASAELESFAIDTYQKKGIDDKREYLHGGAYIREVMRELGFEISYSAPDEKALLPKMLISRNDNGFVYTVYTPNQTVSTSIRTPYGAPILDGYEVEINGGAARYNFPKCVFKECRVFVAQESGVVSVRESNIGSVTHRRKIVVDGLCGATVRIFPEDYCKDEVYFGIFDERHPFFPDDKFVGTKISRKPGEEYCEVENVNGTLLIAMPQYEGRFD